MTEQSRETTGQGNEPASARNADPAPSQQTPPASEAVSPEKQKANRARPCSSRPWTNRFSLQDALLWNGQDPKKNTITYKLRMKPINYP